MKITKAIIPAAGFGTRFLPITKSISKEMLPIIDMPTIELIIKEAVDSGIKEVLVIVNEHKHDIISYFTSNKAYEEFVIKNNKKDLLEVIRHSETLCTIKFVNQQEQKGLGHAVLQAKEFANNEAIAVLLGDNIIVSNKPVTKQLIETYEKYHCSIIGVQKVDEKEVNKYGVVNFDQKEGNNYHMIDIVEKPKSEEAPSNLASLGRYIFTPAIFKHLENLKPGKNGEIQLTDGIVKLMKEENVYANDFEGVLYDTGTKEGYVKAIVDFALNRDDIKEEIKKHILKKGVELNG